jgi:hypothetical protein
MVPLLLAGAARAGAGLDREYDWPAGRVLARART